MAKKKKKQKKPNIPVQTMARPRLEQILVRYEQSELDQTEYMASIERLAEELGREAILNAMIGALENAGNERKDALMTAIPKLGDKQTIKHLWQLVRRSKISVGAKMTALVILKQMGEDVNLDEPGEYLSWRDLKQANSDEIAGMGRFGLRGIIKELQRVKNVDDADALMMSVNEMMEKVGAAEGPAEMMIDELIEMGDNGAADMLAAIAGTTSRPKIREAARKGLLKLSGRKVFPQTEAIRSLQEERFYAAYSTDPAHPWQQQVSIVFERGHNLVQALVFLLDFGAPWNGAIKDFFPSQSMTPTQFQRDMLDRAAGYGAEQGQITYARARQFILDAVEVNQKRRVKLPPEFEQFQHWINRRIIDPSPETLAHAQQVDAQTVDEWGELEGTPIRGMEIITPEGAKSPIMMLGDLDDEFWDDDEFTFDDLLMSVNEFYKVEDEESVLPQEWAVGYLTARYNEGVDVELLDDYWDNISEFIFYLDTNPEESAKNLVDVQDIHLKEFITDFWDEIMKPYSATIEERQSVIDTISDLYIYLSKQGHIPVESAKRVNKAAASILKNAD